jgi:hypothetical protein
MSWSSLARAHEAAECCRHAELRLASVKEPPVLACGRPDPGGRPRANLGWQGFSELTTKWLQRSAHRSVRELTVAIEQWTAAWNENPRPFIRRWSSKWRGGPSRACPERFAAGGARTDLRRRASLGRLRGPDFHNVTSSSGSGPLLATVAGGVEGNAGVPAGPDHPQPGAQEDADGVGMPLAASAGLWVDLGGPGQG